MKRIMPFTAAPVSPSGDMVDNEMTEKSPFAKALKGKKKKKSGKSPFASELFK